jgi:hypothetical protein
MIYKLFVKTGQQWRRVGLDFLSTDEARDEALTGWQGLPFLIVPEHLTG